MVLISRPGPVLMSTSLVSPEMANCPDQIMFPSLLNSFNPLFAFQGIINMNRCKIAIIINNH